MIRQIAPFNKTPMLAAASAIGEDRVHFFLVGNGLSTRHKSRRGRICNLQMRRSFIIWFGLEYLHDRVNVMSKEVQKCE